MSEREFDPELLKQLEQIGTAFEAIEDIVEQLPTPVLETLREGVEEDYDDARDPDTDTPPLETMMATKKLNAIENELLDRREREETEQ